MILITGVNGFIGSHLAQYLNKNGFSIIGVDINSPDIFKEGKFYKLNLHIKMRGSTIERPSFTQWP